MKYPSKWECWQKILKFDWLLTIVDFLPNIVDFQSSEPLTEQTCDVGFETWYENYWGPMMNHRNPLRPSQTKFPWETQKP